MGGFFHGWRRKLGVATLLMACVFMVGWVRSQITQDTFTVRLWASIDLKLVSISQRLLVVIQQVEGKNSLVANVWTTNSIDAGGWDLVFHFTDSTLAKLRNGIANDVLSTGNASMGVDKTSVSVNWLQLPYWLVTIPLTLISLWLLISKPLKSSQKKILEPTSNEGGATS